MRNQTHVFISYSRKDSEIARTLRDRLLDEQFDAYMDLYDIVKGEPWQARLRGLIERADTVLFLVSPESVASTICEWEINEAELREKRIFPVVVRATPTADIPQRLQRLNFTFLDDAGKWHSEFPLLLSALNQDVFWVREHTRLGELALRWDRAGQPNRLLLRGADLVAAEQWRDQRTPNAPQLSALHTDFLRRSRLGSQQRLRAWLSGAVALALFAVGLSTFAYWQRDLAVRNGNTAERRAAELAIDVALSRADQGALNQGLLMLLDASTRYAPAPVPEKLLVAIHDVTRRAMSSRSFWFSARANAFYLADTVAVVDPGVRTIFRIDPLTGDQSQVALPGNAEISAMLKRGNDLLFLTGDEKLYRVDGSEQGPAEPVHLASLGTAEETPVSWFVPEMFLSESNVVVGRRISQIAGSDGVIDQFWRLDLSSRTPGFTEVPADVGDMMMTRGESAYFWDDRAQKMRVLDLDTGDRGIVTAAEFAQSDVSPCRQHQGDVNEALVGVITATVKPGLQSVRCDGIYGALALMSETRALARGTMEEHYLLPAGSDAAAARTQYALQSAITRLGSMGNHKPISWYAGSAENGLVAVSHADRIMLLGLRTEHLQSLLPVDADHVAREIVTPDVTDGGRFYGEGRFAYSGPEGERYRVTVLNLQHSVGLQDWPVVEHTPGRAYRGTCGVQRRARPQPSGSQQDSLVVHTESDGLYRVQFGERRIVVPAGDIRCASLSAVGNRLAVVDDTGLRLFDVGGDEAVEVASIDDPSIRTVSFLGEGQERLLTAHDFKVMAWQVAGNGVIGGETVYRSRDAVLFAEGAPDGDRLLVWVSLGQADVMVRLVPVPDSGMEWMADGPHMLAFNPDVFFDRRGAVYRLEQGMHGELMAPIRLVDLRQRALSTLSPSCRPRVTGEYRTSPCWPANF